MAINPLIPMQGTSVDVAGPANNLAQAFIAKRERERRQPLLDAQIAAAKTQEAGAQRELLNDEDKSVIQGSFVVKQFLDAGDTQGARNWLTTRKQQLSQYGVPTSQTDEGLALLDQDPTGQSLKSVVDANVAYGIQSGVLGAKGKQGYGTTPVFFRDPKTGKIVAAQGSQAGGFYAGGQPIDPGMEPIATPSTIYAQDMQNYRMFQQPNIAGQTRSAEANVDIETKPIIAGAEAEARAGAESKQKVADTARKNATAANVYETGMNNLLSALGDTTTGPIAGRIPAMTANAQIAEGAGAAMTPVLKQMFREAGEGVFTDKDQEMLNAMLPNRKDHPEAAKAKIKMIDDVVRAKLGVSGQLQQPAASNQQKVGRFVIEAE